MDNKFLYHPREISFCGLSGSGKTTLLEKVIEHFNQKKLVVGYAKHDAHQFSFDYPGKDTYRLRQAGAAAISIFNDKEVVMLRNFPTSPSPTLFHSHFQHCDFVLVEGHKFTPLAKVVLLDPQGIMEAEVAQHKRVTNVLAILSANKEPPEALLSFPFFHRDDDKAIADFVLKYFLKYFSKLERSF